MAKTNAATEKSELEIKALNLYCIAMQIWIDKYGSVSKVADSGNPVPPVPDPPHH